MLTKLKSRLARSTKPQLSDANNPTNAAIMLAKPATLIANCLGLGLLMALTACQPAGSMPPSSMNNSSSASNPNTVSVSGKNDKTAQTALYRLNPAPQEGYEVMLKIENAPGPFKQIRWSAMYQAKGCNYVVNEWAGVRGEPEKVLELPFKEQADGSYVATVYLDAMLDEDYYGNGVCKWELTNVGVNGSPSGAVGEVTFSGRTDIQSMRSGAPVALYYLKSRYGALAPKPSDKYEQISNAEFGQLDRNIFGPDLQKDLLSFVLSARRVRR